MRTPFGTHDISPSPSIDVPPLHLDPQSSLEDQEELVLVVVAMPCEAAADLATLMYASSTSG